MSTKTLNKILAVSKNIKTKNENLFTEIYRDVQKLDLVTGFRRTYQPLKEDGEKLPSENKPVTVRVEDALIAAGNALKEIFNITAQLDASNAMAKADVVLNGETVLVGVPAVHLLFLEKKVAGIIDLINHLPTLTTDGSWAKNEALSLYETPPAHTLKTKKVEDWRIIVQATKEHPAQTVKVTEDVTVGTWSVVNFSGAIPASRKTLLLQRAEQVQQAVKVAREEANQTPAVDFATGKLVDFIFA